jgi:hypothetical protein
MLSGPFAAGWPRRMLVLSRYREGTGGKRPFRKSLSHKIGEALQWSDIGVYAHESLLLYIRLLLNYRYLTTHS